LFTRPVTTCTTPPVNNRARLGVETFESRIVPTVSNASIASIVVDGDVDPAATIAEVTQCTNAPLSINFKYTATKTATATAEIQGQGGFSSTRSNLATGTDVLGVFSNLNISGLSLGSHNIKLTVDDPDSGQANVGTRARSSLTQLLS
jgi:hypothetical protein